jgi:hypothetical protein
MIQEIINKSTLPPVFTNSTEISDMVSVSNPKIRGKGIRPS